MPIRRSANPEGSYVCPSKPGPISKIRPSDGCKGDGVLLAVDQWYDFHEFGCHLGNVGSMLEAVRSKTKALLLIAAALPLLFVLGLFVFSFASIPGASRYARSIPLMQEAGLSLYHLRHPRQTNGRHGDTQATEIVLQDPMGIAEDRVGNIYVADRGRWFGLAAIWKISQNGRARLVAGTGHRGAVQTGTNALQSDLGMPEALYVDNANRIYFADSANHVVVRIESDGQLTRIAGTGIPGFNGDHGPAIKASLRQPYDVRLDSQGTVYIADYGNNRVRKVTRDGIIQTVAGTGEQGYSGDGGPATAARLNGPYGIFVDGEDRLLIADSFNHVIRRVNNDGTITTIFGSGRQGYSGDGGLASAASFDTPQSLYVDAYGRTYIGDEHNHAIRFITPDGLISTLIGTGVAGFSEDGSLASEAQLNDPEYMFVRRDGSVVISEGDNGRILVIRRDGTLHTLAGKR